MTYAARIHGAVLLATQHDPAVAADQSRRMVRRLRGARLVVLANAAPSVPFTHTTVSASALRHYREVERAFALRAISSKPRRSWSMPEHRNCRRVAARVAGALAVLPAVLAGARSVPRVCRVVRRLLVRHPGGNPMPTDGWQASVSGQPYLIIDNTCGTNRVLQAAVPANYTYGAGGATAVWHWSAPADTTVACFRVWRSESVGPAWLDLLPVEDAAALLPRIARLVPVRDRAPLDSGEQPYGSCSSAVMGRCCL